MANQMIALQARGPQLLDIGAMTSRFANVMANTAIAKEKQNQALRAREFRELAESGLDVTTPEGFSRLAGLDPEGAAAMRKSALEKRVADADYALKYLGTAREELSRANTPAEAIAIGQRLKEAYPIFAANIDEQLQTIPPDPSLFPDWRENMTLSAMKSADRMKYFRDEVTTELAISETGTPLIVTRGGLNAPTIKQPRSLIPRAPRAGAVEVGEQTTVAPGVGGPEAAPMAAPESMAPMMPGAKSPRLSASMASSLLGLRSNADYQVALQAIKKADPAAAEELRRIMPVFDPALSDAIREAAMAEFEVIPQGGPQGLVTGERGGVGGPDEGYVEAPTPFRLKSPTQSPVPGIYNVSPSAVSTTASAETSGEKSAAYIADLREKLPKSKGALKLATEQLDRDIADVDYVLTNPYREMVVGNVEGKFPGATSFVNIFRSGGQDAQNVQDRLEKINAASVVKFLQQMKEASPQGSSLFGQVTEYEDRLVSVLAGLKQTQDEATFDRALREYRKILVSMRQNLPQVFNDTFKSIGVKMSVPSVAKEPRNSPTISDVQYLRRNKNNPDVVNGFRKEFGENAYKMAIGGR